MNHISQGRVDLNSRPYGFDNLVHRTDQVFSLRTQVSINATDHRGVSVSHKLGDRCRVDSPQQRVRGVRMPQPISEYRFFDSQFSSQSIETQLNRIAVPRLAPRVEEDMLAATLSLHLQSGHQSLHSPAQINCSRTAFSSGSLMVFDTESLCRNLIPSQIINLNRPCSGLLPNEKQEFQFWRSSSLKFEVVVFEHGLNSISSSASFQVDHWILSKDLLINGPIENALYTSTGIGASGLAPTFFSVQPLGNVKYPELVYSKRTTRFRKRLQIPFLALVCTGLQIVRRPFQVKLTSGMNLQVRRLGSLSCSAHELEEFLFRKFLVAPTLDEFVLLATEGNHPPVGLSPVPRFPRDTCHTTTLRSISSEKQAHTEGLTERSLEASRLLQRSEGILIPCIIQCTAEIIKPQNRRKSLSALNIPDWIRTSNLRLRRPTLYPVELRGHDL